MHEERLAGGTVNEVTRVGDVVYKTSGPWTEAIQAVLSHLALMSFR